MGQIDIAGQLRKKNVAMFVLDAGGNVIGLKDKNNNPVIVTNQVFASVPEMLAATPPVNTVAFLDPVALDGVGSAVAPIPIIRTGTRWAPFNNRQQLFKAQFGSLSTPVPSMTVTGAPAAFPLSAYPTFPGWLFSIGDTVRFEYRIRRHGVAAMSHALYFGKHATYNSNSAPIGPHAGAVVDLTGHDYAAEFTFTSATSGISTRNMLINSATGSTAMTELSTNIDITVDQKAYPAITVLSGTDSVDLLSFEAFWIAGKLI